MGKLKTKEQLEEMFRQSRERQARKREREQLKILKAREEVRNELERRKQEKKEARARELALREEERRRNEILKRQKKNRWISDRNDSLYETREELMAACARGEGTINWEKLDALIERTKKKLHSMFTF